MSRTNTERLATSYILSAAWIFGLGGLHRLYNGKIATGLLWLFTLGFLGFGQFVDLFLIPGMVDEYQLKLLAKTGFGPDGLPLNQPKITATATHPSPDGLIVQLLKAAHAKGGKLSITQGVMATGASFVEVEAAMTQMLRAGYANVTNDPNTGTVLYHFHEL
jgi:TM2 domain-containing membrane protein YozV